MEFEREKPNCKFALPDRPSVRQQMEYLSLVGWSPDRTMLLRYWEAAKAMIIKKSWKCELIPDFEKFDIDKETDPQFVTLITWVGVQVRNHVNSLEEPPKN